MRIAYGHQITSNSDPYLKTAQDVSYVAANSGQPGATPVDMFPFRKSYSTFCVSANSKS